MNALEEITLADVVRGAKRYRPFLLLAAATFVLIGVLPAVNGSGNEESGGLGQAGLSVGDQTAEGADGATGDGLTFAPGDATATAAVGGAGGRASSAVGGAAGGGAPVSDAALSAPDCDSATGKLRIPSKVYSPPCVPMWAGASNGGATHPGVTATEIKLVVRMPQPNAAFDAFLAGIGVGDTPEQIKADLTDWANLFNAHYETYGRKVKLIFYDSQNGNDEAGQRADAIQVAADHKPFMTFAGGTSGAGTYISEMAARGIISITNLVQDQELYEKRAPFLYANGLNATDRASALTWGTWIGKRLWGRPAKWAGDATLAQATRKFGLIYPGDMDKSVLELFDQELAKYGAKFAEKCGVGGDSGGQVETCIDKFRSEGINVVASFPGGSASLSLIQPMGYSTSQKYFPEWISNVSVFLGRTLDPDQSAHLYGIITNFPPVTKEQIESNRLFIWEYGRMPSGAIMGQIAGQSLFPLFLGIHLAGPTLNPTTWHHALFNVAPAVGGSAQGFVSTFAAAWKPAGKIWPWPNYSGHNDWVETWWDPTTVGPDEVGNQAAGVNWYNNGAKRYYASQFASTTGEPNNFNPQGAVSSFAAPPPNEVATPYPNKRCGKRC